MKTIENAYKNFLAARASKNRLRILTPLQECTAKFLIYEGVRYINFSSNDYLGLSNHKEVIARSKLYIEKAGVGSSASRLVTGNSTLLESLEKKIALWKQKEAAIIMQSGFQANTTVLPALLEKNVLGDEVIVFMDILAHASMHIGCRLSGVKIALYRHNDMKHLAFLLEKYKEFKMKFILTESVFSMDGDIAPLDQIYALKEQYNCFFICDEAHATGVFGQKGRGLAENADCIIGTFSKAFGSFGAYIACNKLCKDYLINNCSGIIYSTTLPPAVLGSIDATVDIAGNMDEQRMHLHTTSSHVRDMVKKIGLDCGNSSTHIIPVMLKNEKEALYAANLLKTMGIWASAMRPPACRSSRVRISLSAVHSAADIQTLLNGLTYLKDQLC